MANKVLMKGNEAIAEAAIRAGCRHYFGYPITPQTEIAAYMAKRMPKIDGTFLQAESEIAAINMVYGAAAAGVRAMTSSSSPGIALKSEGISYLAGSDLPAVVVNIQRGGPGLGGIQPSQADYFQATKGGGHGDFHLVVLAPNGVQEMYDMTSLAFDIADKYRVTSMLLSDGILGQMMEAVDLDAARTSECVAKPWALTGTKGERAPNIINSLYMNPEDLERTNLDRFARYAQIEQNETRFEQYLTDDAEVIVVAYGAPARIAKNAIAKVRAQGVKAGLIRPITLWPFPKAILAELASRKQTKALVCVELSMGQMIEDVELATRCAKPVLLCARTGGMVPTPEEIVTKILQAERGA
ncbi:MAG: 3-methyl-2-oxobutanoate dehydrogenase subunit VorB [Oscillospiraceae bacterium]|nr:3-methyl-2-oxobutanoate dehydrogenase subunit VorB [Oscillospiraceae bacterium]